MSAYHAYTLAQATALGSLKVLAKDAADELARVAPDSDSARYFCERINAVLADYKAASEAYTPPKLPVGNWPNPNTGD